MQKIFILGLALFTGVILTQAQTKSAQDITSKKVDKPKTVKTASGLQYTITSQGNGPQAHMGDNVKVHYTGKFTNDTVFDSSVNRGTPFEFMLGRGRVIKGWDEGISYLHVGDKATFIIPPAIGYGDQDSGPIPANSTLVFDVELLGVSEGVKLFDIKKRDTLKTASGLKYLIAQANPKGEKPLQGGRVVANYVAYFTDGTIFDATADRGKPFSFLLGKNQVVKGWDEGVSLMRTGEKFRLIIPYELAYGEQGYQGVIPPKATILLDIELLEVKAPIKPTLYDVAGKEVQTTTSGLKYIIVNKGSGAKAEAGKNVKVHYTGFLDNGTIFDSSVERGEPIEFPLGQGRVIKGWDEGIGMMNVGDKMRLIIPYDLAYGEAGRPPIIPAKAQLTFDVELVEVK
ncbi:MAG: FKBP-type peptidyl-prolyl cis-trans isomerase [Bacteroidia bacterium]|nr:FKBP-type peptidyl-prolyl cis-trans isomerase [Bacteroidia bacterium]